MKIAVIGSGISGISASWFLKNEHNITLFEKQNRFGGHANTSTVEYNNRKINVDTGFIVFNYKTYHHLQKLFMALNIEVNESKMSFGVSNGEIEYSSVAPFANLNFLKADYLKMLFEIARFNRVANRQKIDSKITLDEYLNHYAFSEYFRRNYIYAMAGSIWSCSLDEAKKYPAKSFVDFFKHHGLLQMFNHPQWYCVKGGSVEYVTKIMQDIKAVKSEVIKVLTEGDQVRVIHQNGEEVFDKVIVATHADEAFAITEETILSRFKYSKNLAVLHKDPSFMPKNRKTWASWNYVSDFAENLSLTYWMNNLQNIDNNFPLFVTLNPARQIKDDDIFYQTTYHHPIFDFASLEAVRKIDSIQGKGGIYYAGSYLGYGFHEDGIASSYNICKNLVQKMPW